MAKFLVQASYTPDGLKGLIKDKAAARIEAAKKAASSVGGKVEAFYWTLGEDDAIIIADFPDADSAAALGIAVSSTGLVRTKTTRLLTAEEIDKALAKTVSYRAPGK
jgi:uncharacterized protein with GYD domain